MTELQGHMFVGDRFAGWLSRPQHFLRLELVRICAPLAILGFMSSRIAHADEWVGDAGFRVPELASSDYRQPLYLPALGGSAAWIYAVVLVASGLALAAGWRSRVAAIVFAGASAWAALADRLASFSVSKLAPVVAIALATSACGARWSIDAWRRAKRGDKLPNETTAGAVRFFQLLLPTIYCASGIAKARADWLREPYVLWSHLHDTYQTAITVILANALPPMAWTIFQIATLAFEALAPLWFAWKKTRGPALVFGVGMHGMIGLMFGPVIWFAMLMATLLVASFLPDRFLDRLARL
ncbi:MAG TPA: HTTM domain-containing protein [Labilithrix sp.]